MRLCSNCGIISSSNVYHPLSTNFNIDDTVYCVIENVGIGSFYTFFSDLNKAKDFIENNVDEDFENHCERVGFEYDNNDEIKDQYLENYELVEFIVVKPVTIFLQKTLDSKSSEFHRIEKCIEEN